MKRIHYKDGTYKDVENNHSWEYENDPDWKENKDLTENRCENETKIPERDASDVQKGIFVDREKQNERD